MNNIPEQIVENVFPEERKRLLRYLREQKRNLVLWLVLFATLGLLYLGMNLIPTLRYIISNPQVTLNWILFWWIITIVVVSSVWPQKPGDVFREDFKKGINPRVWEYEGNWKTELDEKGKPVLTVTHSELGGLVIPCLSWTDYEVEFATRILNQCTGWLIRASSLNDCVMIQITATHVRPHVRAGGVWLLIGEYEHNLPIKTSEWYGIRTLARGAWVTVYVTIDGKEHMVLQSRILGTRPPVRAEIELVGSEPAGDKASQLLSVSVRTGSFGFRLYGSEEAQFRSLRAYGLK